MRFPLAATIFTEAFFNLWRTRAGFPTCFVLLFLCLSLLVLPSFLVKCTQPLLLLFGRRLLVRVGTCSMDPVAIRPRSLVR